MSIFEALDKFQKIIKILQVLILSILLYIIIISHKNYKYCFNCSKIKKIYSKCFKCPNSILFNRIYIESKENTLNEIIKYHKSISRFGDGEYKIIFGKNIRFQKYNKNLSKRLLEVLNSNAKNLLIGIYVPYKKKKLSLYTNKEVAYWTGWLSKYKFNLLKILNKKKYYSADITRFYYKYKDKSGFSKYIAKLKKIWEGRDILIVEGEKTRFGLGNDLINNTKSIKRIICPTKNAFTIYDKLLVAILKVDINNLILISLGPTATVLAYDLTKLGYQAVDIGHADIMYELYLRNSTKMIRIPYKYVNEYKNRNKYKVENVTNKDYYNQIINKVF